MKINSLIYALSDKSKKSFSPIKKALLLIFPILCTTAGLAQEDRTNQMAWVECGINMSISDRAVLDLGINYNQNKHLFTAQLQGIAGELFDGPVDQLRSFNLLYGRMTKSKFFSASISAGLGFGQHTNFYITTPIRSVAPKKVYSYSFVPSIPIEAKLGLKLGVVGFHVKAGASINSEIPVAYFGFGFDFGKLF